MRAVTRTWVCSTHADFAHGRPKRELLATCFLNPQNAQQFQQFEERWRDGRESRIWQKTMMPRKVEKLVAPTVKEESTGVCRQGDRGVS